MSDKNPTNAVKVRMTADDISQAIGEWLYHAKKLPRGMEEGVVNFRVEDGEFIIEVYNPSQVSTSLN
jgi:hypothetical protein